MMPAASNKVEQKTSSLEAQDPLKLALVMLDKKVRNLDKRKVKLDAIRTKAASGAVLEKEQEDAVKYFDEVAHHLNFAKELQKQMSGIAAEAEKLQKKQAKREKQERAATELRRMTEMLQIQTTLDCLGSEKVREHFKTGKYGAVVLTEDNLAQLDELYQLISPSRETSVDFSAALTSASEHIVNMLEGRDRAVVGSTYKELRELIALINECGYFERARAAEELEEHVMEEKKVETETVKEMPSSLPPPSEPFHKVSEPEEVPTLSGIHQAAELEDSRLPHPQVMQPSMAPEPTASYFVPTPTSSAYQTAQAQPQPIRVRPIDEIVSAVQGTFNFLQESMIDVDSPHMDPAVVAAQPMMRPPSAGQPQTSMLPPVAYPSTPFSDPSSIAVDQQQAPSTHVSDVHQEALSLSQQSMTQSKLDYGSGQAFGQASLSHSQNLPSMGDPLFQSSVEGGSAGAVVNQQRGHSMIGAGEAASQFEIPPSIPMPPSQSQEGPQITTQEKKFQMNASAPVFQSMYSQTNTVQAMTGQPVQQPAPPQQSSPPQNQQDAISNHPSTAVGDFSSAPANFASAAGDYSQAAGNGFPNSSFQRGGRNGGPANYRGGQRGARGASNSSTMQNGFSPRPSSGSNRGGRGNSTYQGFPPRNDYRPDGYQGFSNNGFGPNNYQKRGGPGGMTYPRGGANNRGAAGIRGGAPRGGGPPRGGNTRGGMTRPVNAQ